MPYAMGKWGGWAREETIGQALGREGRSAAQGVVCGGSRSVLLLPLTLPGDLPGVSLSLLPDVGTQRPTHAGGDPLPGEGRPQPRGQGEPVGEGREAVGQLGCKLLLHAGGSPSSASNNDSRGSDGRPEQAYNSSNVLSGRCNASWAGKLHGPVTASAAVDAWQGFSPPSRRRKTGTSSPLDGLSTCLEQLTRLTSRPGLFQQPPKLHSIPGP